MFNSYCILYLYHRPFAMVGFIDAWIHGPTLPQTNSEPQVLAAGDSHFCRSEDVLKAWCWEQWTIVLKKTAMREDRMCQNNSIFLCSSYVDFSKDRGS